MTVFPMPFPINCIPAFNTSGSRSAKVPAASSMSAPSAPSLTAVTNEAASVQGLAMAIE
jgi:hypothetical protein